MSVVALLYGGFLAVGLVLGLLVRMIHDLQQDTKSQKAEHAKCMAMVAGFVGDEFAAVVLREAATAWDSIEEQGQLRRLANEVYQAGGPSMPTIWLNARANTLSPKMFDFNEVGEFK